MNALPIVTRELIVRARLPQMHWTRMAFAAFGVVICLQFFLLWRGMDLSQVGGYAFATLAWMAFLLASAGFVLTADSISSERRRGTLGLLLLTRVGVHDVLAGKLTSAGLSAMLGLVAVAPAFMLPVLAGGVTWTQVVLVALALPGLLFFSLCAGLWASSGATRMGRSFLRGAVCVVLGVKLPLMLSVVFAAAPPLGDWCKSFSPGGAFLWGVGSATSFTHAGYWRSVAAGFALGGILLWLAIRNLREPGREQGPATGPDAGEAGGPRPGVGEASPVRWLLLRSPLQSKLIWMAAGLLLLPRAASVLLPALQFSVMGIIQAFHFVTTFSAAMVLSAAGAMFFLEGRRTGALELLRTTPEGHRRVLVEQWQVLRQRLTAPVSAVVVVILALDVISWTSLRGMPGALAFSMPQQFGAMASMVFDALALCWLGMWFGLSARGTWSALLWPVALVTGANFVLTLIAWGVLSVFLNGLAYRGVGGGLVMSVLVALPWVAVIAKQVWLIRWAKRRLHETLAGATVEPLELSTEASLAARRAVAALRRTRHWTAGGDR